MADRKISALGSHSSPSGSDYIVINDVSASPVTTKRTTVDQLRTALNIPDDSGGGGGLLAAPTNIDFVFNKRHAAWRNTDSTFTVAPLDWDRGVRPQQFQPTVTKPYTVPAGCDRLGVYLVWQNMTYNYDSLPGYSISSGYRGRVYGFNFLGINGTGATYLTAWTGTAHNITQNYVTAEWRLNHDGSTNALKNQGLMDYKHLHAQSSWHVAKVTPGSSISFTAGSFLQQISECQLWQREMRIAVFPYNSGDSQDPFTISDDTAVPRLDPRYSSLEEQIMEENYKEGTMSEEDDKQSQFTHIGEMIRHSYQVLRITLDSGKYAGDDANTQRLQQAIEKVYKTNEQFGAAPWQTHNQIAAIYLYGDGSYDNPGVIGEVEDLLVYPMAGVADAIL